MTDVLTEPVFWTGLLGLAGIVATFFAPTWSNERIERRRESRQFRRAKRLVAHELDVCASALRLIVDQGVVPPIEVIQDAVFLPGGAWEEERATLATMLEDEDWVAVDDAFEGVGIARRALRSDAEQEDDTGDMSLDDDKTRFLLNVAERAERSQDQLPKAKPAKD